MSQTANRNIHICKQCQTRFRGPFCPYCGAEYGASRRRTDSGGIVGGVFRFIGTLLVLALILLIALVILDSTPYAHNPNNATAYAILSSIRNAIPAGALAKYEVVRSNVFNFVAGVLETLFD